MVILILINTLILLLVGVLLISKSNPKSKPTVHSYFEYMASNGKLSPPKRKMNWLDPA